MTPAQRRELGEAAAAGHKIRKLARKYNCTADCVRRWRDEAKKPRPNYSDAPRSGRPAALSAAERSRARRSARSGRSVPQVTASINQKRQKPVSTGTVRQALVDSKCPLQWAPVNRGRTLSAANMSKRFDFCQDHLNAQTGAWLFSDSKLIYCYKDGASNNTWAWQEAGQEQQQRRGGDPVVFHVFAVVGKGVKSKLVYTAPSAPKGSKQRKGKENFASKHFIAVAEQLHKTIKTWGKDSSRHPIVLDHAKPHSSDASKAAIEDMGMHIMQDFPAQSWDINIIENVWGVLDTNLKHGPPKLPSTPDGWRRRINKAWDDIPQSTIDKLVGSVKGRMQGIVEKEGAWLYKHK